jgi:hypothetical protein
MMLSQQLDYIALMTGDKTRTTIHAVSGIKTHSLSVPAIKAYTTDCMAIATGWVVTFGTLDLLGNLI